MNSFEHMQMKDPEYDKQMWMVTLCTIINPHMYTLYRSMVPSSFTWTIAHRETMCATAYGPQAWCRVANSKLNDSHAVNACRTTMILCIQREGMLGKVHNIRQVRK